MADFSPIASVSSAYLPLNTSCVGFLFFVLLLALSGCKRCEWATVPYPLKSHIALRPSVFAKIGSVLAAKMCVCVGVCEGIVGQITTRARSAN